MKQYLGIDPGLSGALAFYDPVSNALEILDMPTYSLTRNGKSKRMLDLHTLANIVDDRAANVKMAAVEEVGAMPGQGVTSMFSFGFNAAAAQMAVIANGVHLTLVTPRVWKKAMGLKADKDSARQKASRVFPKHTRFWARAKDDGRAEAALLAYYLWDLHGHGHGHGVRDDVI